MTWLRSFRQRPPKAARHVTEKSAIEEPFERTSPALRALFASLTPDGRHAILDLGSASEAQMAVLGTYARMIRFLGLVPGSPDGADLENAWTALTAGSGPLFDVVLAWDVLDSLGARDRGSLVERLAEATVPGAQLYAGVDASSSGHRRRTRSVLAGTDRVVQHPVGRPEPAPHQLLPAAVEKALAPFEVVQAFSLRIGMREYLARKR